MQLNNNIYTVDWNKWVRWLVPGVLRRPKMLAFIRSVIMPVNTIHTSFLYYRNNALYRLAITPQVCYLERALNDRYDVMERRIYIQDSTTLVPVPLYRQEESKQQVLYRKGNGEPITFYTKAETLQFTSDFIISIPVTVNFNMSELTAFVNSYKLTSKTFKVKII